MQTGIILNIRSIHLEHFFLIQGYGTKHRLIEL
ncbi:hypothetical protein XNC3_1510003 [Xenorhabdus nematophila F1]|nr:hypothetical protein XNC3_1510003 [Xenorhabdus nematophila F1]